MTDAQMETLLNEMRGLAAITNEALTVIHNHQKASDPARDTHVTREATRVIDAMPKGGGGGSTSGTWTTTK